MPDPRSERFVRSHLKTRHLVLLVELGRHRSIVQAARAASLTQPAASRLLAELEHALGVPLFERLPRGIEPTWYGQVMIRRAGAALAEMDAAHQEVMDLFSGARGRVAIGTVLTPSTTLVPAAITLLAAGPGQVQVSVTVESSTLLIERLRDGALDLVIGRIPDAGVAAELNFEPIGDEAHSVIARAGHPLAARADLTLADLAGASWILPPAGSVLRDRLAALFLADGLAQPSDSVETMAMTLIPPLLMGSDLLVALPEELVRFHLASGALAVLPFELRLARDVYGIVTRKQHQLSPAAQAMLDCLRAAHAARQRNT